MEQKYIPLNKRSKAEQRKYYNAQRGSWNGVNPVPRIVENKKRYSRARMKAERYAD